MKNLRKAILTLVLFILFQNITTAQTADFGKSYINVTKGVNGGTVEPGDTLEIRASVVIGGSAIFDSLAFYDAVPAGTTYLSGTIRILTNEGKTYRQLTDSRTDDAGWISGNNITINLGFNAATFPATAFRRGQVAYNDRPRFYSSTCIMIASFRVVVNSGYGSSIATGGGTITYRNAASRTNPVLTHRFPANLVAVFKNYGICPNSIGANALGTEFNGTFGAGTAQNRGSSTNVPPGYTYNAFDENSPQDYYYGIANNTSNGFNFTTLNTWAKPDNASVTHRVHRLWDIIGDHTGAADPYEGNAPGDKIKTSGYMLVINAAYRIDSAFQQTISGLCPNTYYEISAWMRNICSKCGCDENGIGASSGNTAYIPTAPGDSSGVKPNLTFEVDGVDYYTTGNLEYTGKWVKKGFTFLTGPSQTSFTLKFFNNAPGGGGNDWALDDISVAVCNPNLLLTPTSNPIVCNGNVVDMGATIQSYFGNHNNFKWQKSTDNGTTWNETGITGSGTPVWAGNSWEYKISFPQFVASRADSGTKYKILVGTTAANLQTSCSFNANTSAITLNVITCGPILQTDILSFSGQRQENTNVLHWTTGPEKGQLKYIVERSTDGLYFSATHSIPGRNDGSSLNTYEFSQATDKTWFYRIRMTDEAGSTKFSKLLRLGATPLKPELFIGNPFGNQIQAKLEASEGMALLTLIDMNGRVVKSQQLATVPGINTITLNNTGHLPEGVYILQVATGGELLSKRLLKKNRL